MNIEIVFDPAKDEANRRRHGVSLELARQIDWSTVMAGVDDRHDYGEVREIGYAPIGTRLYCVVFTQRVISLRIISLRKANYRELDRYEQETEAYEALSRGGSPDPARNRLRSGNVHPFRRAVREDETAGPAAP
ncbi:BrnT family toxin [Caballeronia choica]|uniref:BrnT family toxin n=1 Tax=Caballeronia choica TaxID=326476 RepID=UPI000AD8A284